MNGAFLLQATQQPIYWGIGHCNNMMSDTPFYIPIFAYILHFVAPLVYCRLVNAVTPTTPYFLDPARTSGGTPQTIPGLAVIKH